MSKKNTNSAINGAAEEKKIQTRYDRKMQQRKEAEERAKKEKRNNTIIAVLVMVLLVVFIASFPIRKAMALKAPYFNINGEAVTQVEFDYNRAMAKANFLTQNSYYFSMFGMDMSTIESQNYNDTLTFADYFDQLAAEQIVEMRALKNAGEAEGFVYDTTADYEEAIANIKEVAEEQEIAYSECIKTMYGSLATEKRLEKIIKDSLYALAYREKVQKDKEPADTEITAYYEANKDSYDSVDYHMTTIKAELPTTAPDGSVPKDEEGNEIAYQPTEEEIATAMAEAKKKAESAEATIATDGEIFENVNIQESYIQENLKQFLYDASRKAQDTCVLENSTNNSYTVASFDKRYLDNTLTQSARIIITSTMDSQTILDEWKAGAATEESFIEILKKYDEAGSSSMDGLYEGISENMVNEEIYTWMSAVDRKAGDTMAINIEEEANYVLYYVGQSDPKWKILIRESLLSEEMTAYLEELASKYSIEDPDGKLKYLTAEAATQG